MLEEEQRLAEEVQQRRQAKVTCVVTCVFPFPPGATLGMAAAVRCLTLLPNDVSFRKSGVASWRRKRLSRSGSNSGERSRKSRGGERERKKGRRWRRGGDRQQNASNILTRGCEMNTGPYGKLQMRCKVCLHHAAGPPQGGGKTPGKAAEGRSRRREAAENCGQVEGEGASASGFYSRGIRSRLMGIVS